MFSHPELRRYRTHICSKASLLLVVILFLTFIPPLFVVYRSYGMWKVNTLTNLENENNKFIHALVCFSGWGKVVNAPSLLPRCLQDQDRGSSIPVRRPDH